MKIDKLILILVLFVIAVFGYQFQFLSYFLSIVVVGYFIFTGELSIGRYKVLFPLVLLLIIGTRLGTGFKRIDIIRDYVYFSTPILSFIWSNPLQKTILI